MSKSPPRLKMRGAAAVATATALAVTQGCAPPSPCKRGPTIRPPALSCDAGGDATVYPATKPAFEGIGKPEPHPHHPCTGAGVDRLGELDDVGFSFEGSPLARCGKAEDVPLTGTLTMIFTNVDPATGKPYVITADLEADPCRPQPGPADAPEPGPMDQPQPGPIYPQPTRCRPEPEPHEPPFPFEEGEAVCLEGQVQTGPYSDRQIGFAMLVHPVPAEDLDDSGGIEHPQPHPMVPTMDSWLTFATLADEPEPVPVVWSTDGAGFATLAGDDEAVLDGGIVLSPRPHPAICRKA